MKNSLFIIIINILIFMSVKAQNPIEVTLKYQKLCEEIIKFEKHPNVYFFKVYDGINLFSTVFESYSRIWTATSYQIKQEELMFIELKALFDGYIFMVSQMSQGQENTHKVDMVKTYLRMAIRVLNEPASVIARNHRQYKETLLTGLNKTHEYLKEVFNAAEAEENKSHLSTHTK